MNRAVGVRFAIRRQGSHDTNQVCAFLLTIGNALYVLGIHLGIDQRVVAGIWELGGNLVDRVACLPAAANDQIVVFGDERAHVVLKGRAVRALGNGIFEAVLGSGFLQPFDHLHEKYLGTNLVANECDLEPCTRKRVGRCFRSLRCGRSSCRRVVCCGGGGRATDEEHGCHHERQNQCEYLFHALFLLFIE
ncbi:hypothetical protein SDC9_188703 [bioreactor metagenome]|uniref:Uncharacterized protein n=1 Tax=bioreactor metagenome TaxID=1076179 RepID=A0A645HQ23_9ZZZZ